MEVEHRPQLGTERLAASHGVSALSCHWSLTSAPLSPQDRWKVAFHGAISVPGSPTMTNLNLGLG